MTLQAFTSLMLAIYLALLCLLYFFQLQRKSRLEKMDYQKIRCKNCGAQIVFDARARHVKCIRCGATNRFARNN